jgi:hypothetical protein
MTMMRVVVDILPPPSGILGQVLSGEPHNSPVCAAAHASPDETIRQEVAAAEHGVAADSPLNARPLGR